MSVLALNRWLRAQAVLWLPLLAACACLTPPGSPAWRWLLAAAAAAALFSAAVLWRILRTGGRVADHVTGIRMVALTGLACAVAIESRITWALWAGLLTAVALDLADGWFARRFGGSKAGAILDMEADQFAVTLLALMAAGFAAAGPWLLLLPAMKHGYVIYLTARGLPAHDPRPRAGDNRIGRWICTGVLTTLLVVTAPVAPRIAVIALGPAAVIALGWSFGRDVLYLVRRRGDRASVPG